MEAQSAGSPEPEKHGFQNRIGPVTPCSLLFPVLIRIAGLCCPLPVLLCSGARKATYLSRFTGAHELHLNDHSDQMVTEGLRSWTKLMLQWDETLGPGVMGIRQRAPQFWAPVYHTSTLVHLATAPKGLLRISLRSRINRP